MNFWNFQDKPNKRLVVHRAECGTRNGRQPPLFRGKIVARTYANYDEAFGNAKEMSPVKALKSTAAFAIPNTRPDIGTGERSIPRPATEN